MREGLKLTVESLWGCEGVKALFIEDDLLWKVPNVVFLVHMVANKQGTRPAALGSGKMVQEESSLTLLLFLPICSPSWARYCLKRAQPEEWSERCSFARMAFWANWEKTQDRFYCLRIQLNWVGVSWDKAKVLFEPEGFLVLLNFKGLLQQVEVLMMLVTFYQAFLKADSDRQPKYSGCCQLPL